MPEGVYGIGIKGPDPALTPAACRGHGRCRDHWADHTTVDFGPIRMTTRQLWELTRHYTGSPSAGGCTAGSAGPAPADCWANRRRRR